MTTIVYNECITSISLLLKNVNDLYMREKEATLKLSELEKENESLRQLLHSKEASPPKDTNCQQAPGPTVSQFPEGSILMQSARILADLVQPTQLSEQRDGKDFYGQIGSNRVKTMLQILGMDDDVIPNDVCETKYGAKAEGKTKESHSKQGEQWSSQASVKVEGETMDEDIGAERQCLEIHDLSEDDNLVGNEWPLADRKRKCEPCATTDEIATNDRTLKDTKALKSPRVVKQGNTRTPVMANARLAVVGMVFGGGICVREVDSTKGVASLETMETDFPEGKRQRLKANNKHVADVVASTPILTPPPQDAQRSWKFGEDNPSFKCHKITDTFKCKRSGGFQGASKMSQTNSCGRADRRNRRLLSSLVHKRGQNRSVGKAVLEELSSDTDDEKNTLELRSGMEETSDKDSDPYIPDSDHEPSGDELAATPMLARRRLKKLKKFDVHSDQLESDSEFESVLSGIQRAFDV